MKLIDITVPLSAQTPSWPRSPEFNLHRWLSIDHGDAVNNSAMAMDLHTGTHIDGPCHVLKSGADTDSIDLGILIGPAEVVTLPGVDRITADVLHDVVPNDTDRLLFKTGNSALWRNRDFVDSYAALTADAARYIVERGIRLVGIDYLSIELWGCGGTVHEILLGNGVVVLEGLDLTEADGGHYHLICLPLRIPHADGAPVRAVLQQIDPSEEVGYDE